MLNWIESHKRGNTKLEIYENGQSFVSVVTYPAITLNNGKSCAPSFKKRNHKAWSGAERMINAFLK